MSVKVQMQCPKCGGAEMWDNRTSKTNPKAPDFKCTERTCTGVVWPPKNGVAPVAKAAPARPAQETPRVLPHEFDNYPEQETAELNNKTGVDFRAHTRDGKIAEAAALWNAARIQVLGYAPDFANDWQALNAAIATILIAAQKAA